MADDEYDSFDDFVADSQDDTPKKPKADDIVVEDSQSQSSQEPAPENDTLIRMEDEEEVKQSNESEDIIKILVATDIHCGYAENKPIINEDSIIAFEEVLQIATEQKVDFVLLGGDLFHENHPSREVLNKVTRLLRKYCLNDNPIGIEFLSDPSINFNQSVFSNVNFYDENINVGLPIFTIHGNHDDLSGKNLTALDNLHESGLINLFGKHEQIKKFEISPILLRKGDTRLALFGIGSQRDDRLARAFQEDDVTFYRPKAGAEDWFNLFVLHQNRPRRSMVRTTGSYLPETLIPKFFDLLIWGHEHESKPQPQYVASSEAVGDGFYILQPGSTVATSLTEDEALPKNAFLIKIKGRKFASKPIPLQTTRPILVDELILDTIPAGMRLEEKTRRPKNGKGEYCDELAIHAKLEEMIEKARQMRGPRQQWPPLIRLKVTYEKDWECVQPIHGKRMGYKYESIVANPLEMVVVSKKKAKRGRKTKDKEGNEIEERLGNVSATNLQYIINDYFSNLPLAEKMTVLKPEDIGKALERYSGEGEAKSAAMAQKNAQFLEALKNQMAMVKGTLKKMPIPELKDEKDLKNFKAMIEADVVNLKKSYYERKGGLNGKQKETSITLNDDDDDEDDDHRVEVFTKMDNQNLTTRLGEDDDDVTVLSDGSDIDMSMATAPPKRGRGRGRGRATGTTSTRGRAKKNAF